MISQKGGKVKELPIIARLFHDSDFAKIIPDVLAEQVILDDAPHRLNPVFPADFFPLGICSSRIGNADFIYATFIFSGKLGYFCNKFRFNSKPI
jgi:hypothetical protein